MDLANLPDLPRDALKQLWQKLFHQDPPHKLGRKLMLLAIAYKLQERVIGGLKPSVSRRIALAGEAIAAGKPLAAPAPVKPGTRLLREWQGTTHEVIVLDNCVRYQGKTWRSLSEVARAITGARWSGPRFFGLKEPRA
ncbi:DUF2924 domain-containing protein [Magnetospirillum sp. 15-1]|uniref:DUF2924 domain-containing protein n=1 Tax=Magnetospirillum sp. 15-1 TaxID=1979370 RepID=UPI0018D52003|nr:DUF2924 domain-containing protein [Magnetospirillum sp. 15-1]